MGTPKQKRLAQLIVENATRPAPLNKKQLLVTAGYSPVSAEATPSRLIDQTGVQEELEALGFNIHSAKKVVQEIMLSSETEPNARLKATDQVFKVLGGYAPEKSVNLNIEVESDDAITKLADQLNALHQGTSISSDGTNASVVGEEVQHQE